MSTCRYCALEAPSDVLRCPHCRSPLRGIEYWQGHPGLNLLMAVLSIGALLVAANLAYGRMKHNMRSVLGPPPTPAPQVVVTESRVEISERDGMPMVVVVGQLHNQGPRTVRRPILHLECLAPDGRVSDVAESRTWTILPPGATSAFKVSIRREFELVQYAAHRVTVVSAARN